MKIEITSREANVIQVAIDHLYDEHSDVLSDAIRTRDADQIRSSAHILQMCDEIQREIKYKLSIKK